MRETIPATPDAISRHGQENFLHPVTESKLEAQIAETMKSILEMEQKDPSDRSEKEQKRLDALKGLLSNLQKRQRHESATSDDSLTAHRDAYVDELMPARAALADVIPLQRHATTVEEHTKHRHTFLLNEKSETLNARSLNRLQKALDRLHKNPDTGVEDVIEFIAGIVPAELDHTLAVVSPEDTVPLRSLLIESIHELQNIAPEKINPGISNHFERLANILEHTTKLHIEEKSSDEYFPSELEKNIALMRNELIIPIKIARDIDQCKNLAEQIKIIDTYDPNKLPEKVFVLLASHITPTYVERDYRYLDENTKRIVEQLISKAQKLVGLYKIELHKNGRGRTIANQDRKIDPLVEALKKATSGSKQTTSVPARPTLHDRPVQNSEHGRASEKVAIFHHPPEEYLEKNTDKKSGIVSKFYQEMAADVQAFTDDSEPVLIPADMTNRLQKLTLSEQLTLIRDNQHRLKPATISRFFYSTIPQADLDDPHTRNDIKKEYDALSAENKKTYDELARTMLTDSTSSGVQKDSAAQLLFIIRENDTDVYNIEHGTQEPQSKGRDTRSESSRSQTVLTARTAAERGRKTFTRDWEGFLDLTEKQNQRMISELSEKLGGKISFKEYITAVETLLEINPKKAADLRETNQKLYYEITFAVRDALASNWSPQLTEKAKQKLEQFQHERSKSLVTAHDEEQQKRSSSQNESINQPGERSPSYFSITNGEPEDGTEPTLIRNGSKPYELEKDVEAISHIYKLSQKEIEALQSDTALPVALSKRRNEVWANRKDYIRSSIVDRIKNLEIITTQQGLQRSLGNKLLKFIRREKTPEEHLNKVYKKILKQMN